MTVLPRHGWGLVLVWALLACGDDGTGPGPGAGRIGPEGGEVASADGDAIVRVPAGALREPILIEVERLEPDLVPGVLSALELVSGVYRFGPDGLGFATPVRIEIYFDADLLPPDVALEDLTIGKATVTRQLEELTGQEILDPESAGLELHVRRRGVGGQVSSFSPFAVWVDESEEPVPSSHEISN